LQKESDSISIGRVGEL